MPDHPTPPSPALEVSPAAPGIDPWFERAPQALVVVDAAGRVVKANAAARSLFGEPATREGLAFDSLAPRAPPNPRAVEGPATVREAVGRRADGTPFPAEVLQSTCPAGEGVGAVVSVRDLSVQRALEHKLRQREQDIGLLFEQASDGLFVSDASGRYLDVNPAGEMMLGYTRAELCTLTIADVVSPEEIARVEPEIRALTAGGPVRSTWKFRRKDGSTFRGEVSARQLADTRFLAVLRDVSERARVEDELRRSEARLNEAQALTQLGSWELDLASGSLEWSLEAYRIFGVAPAAFGRSYEAFLALVHPDDREALARQFESALAQGHPYFFEHRIVLPDGREKILRERGQIVYDPSGRAVRAIGTVKDITERRRMETSLRLSQARMAAIVATTLDAVITIDGAKRIAMFNAAAEKMFKVSAAEVLGGTLDRFIAPTLREAHRRHVEGYARSGDTARVMGATRRVTGIRSDGEEFPIDASISRLDEGDELLLTVILRDISARERAERELMTYQRELSDLAHRLMDQERITTKRLAQALHDRLGQTLAAIRLEFVAECAFADPMQTARHRRVDRLIDQAIDQVRRVLIDLRPTVLDERGLVAALDNELEVRRPTAGSVRLDLDVAPGLRRRRWPQDVEYAAFMVAREALANALRHARATRVRVSLAGDAHALILEVADDGIGLAPADHEVRPGHLGMIGMRERAAAIGAGFGVTRVADGGTLARLSWREPGGNSTA